jgi:DNA-binding NarL/FixJ family response regulator
MESERCDVFLSYNRDDQKTVEALAKKLRRSGIKVWVDLWNLVPGEPWQPKLEEALSSSSTCAVFIGPSGIGPWQHEEMRAAIDRRVHAATDRFRVIPVILPGASERGLPTFLVSTTWVKFTTHNDGVAFRQLLSGIRGTSSSPDSAPEPALFAVVITATITQMDKPVVEAIASHLRKLSRDASLTVVNIATGSVIITVAASGAALERLESLFRNGNLSKLAGFTVQGVRWDLDYPRQIEQNRSTSSSGRYRIVICSDEPLLSKSLESKLQLVEGLELTPTCTTLANLVETISKDFADLVLLDLTPEITFAVLTELKHAIANSRIVLWVNTISTELAFQAMGLGVRGILRKTLPTELQVKCIQKVLAGELWFEKALTDSFLCARRVALTQREGQLVSLLSQGLTSKQIATTLEISEGTVKVYLFRLFAKVGVKDRSELALFGLKNLTTGQLPIGEKGHGATGMPGLRSLVLDRPTGSTKEPDVPRLLRPKPSQRPT